MKIVTVEAVDLTNNGDVVIADEAENKSKDFPHARIIKITKPTDAFSGKPYDHEIIVMTAISSTQYTKQYFAPNCLKGNSIVGNPRRKKTVKLPISLPVLDEFGKHVGKSFTTTNELWAFLLTAEGGYKALQSQTTSTSPKSEQPKKKPRKKTEWGI